MSYPLNYNYLKKYTITWNTDMITPLSMTYLLVKNQVDKLKNMMTRLRIQRQITDGRHGLNLVLIKGIFQGINFGLTGFMCFGEFQDTPEDFYDVECGTEEEVSKTLEKVEEFRKRFIRMMMSGVIFQRNGNAIACDFKQAHKDDVIGFFEELFKFFEERDETSEFAKFGFVFDDGRDWRRHYSHYDEPTPEELEHIRTYRYDDEDTSGYDGYMGGDTDDEFGEEIGASYYE